MKEKRKSQPPVWLEFLLKLFVAEEEFYEKLGDYSEAYSVKVEEKNKFKASIWYLKQIVFAIPIFFINTISWGFIMFKHYLVVSLRNFGRQKLYSIINVLGLAIGLAACLIILFWVQDEMSYDKFNKNYNNIYRINRELKYEGREVSIPVTSYPYGPTMVSDFPEVINSVHFVKNELFILDKRNVFNRQEVFCADNSIFEIFDYKLLSGNPATALIQPNSLVISPALAKKYFNTLDVIGKTLQVQEADKLVDYAVTGILDEVPINSHIQFEALLSFSTFPEESRAGWPGNWLYTYVLLKEGTSVEELKQKFPDFLEKYLGPEIAPYLGRDQKLKDVIKLNLIPLSSIHLEPAEHFEIQPQGSISSVYIFSAIAVLILFIACMNFMNLSSARAGKRAKEVGLRKAIGAHYRQLWKQFIGESIITSIAALVLAIILIILFLPGFNSVAGKNLSAEILLVDNHWIYLIVITLITGIIAGLYPAFILSSYNPVKVFKNESIRGGRAFFRKTTTVFQFVISIALIICTLVVYKQMQFMQNKELGFDKENLLIIEAQGDDIVQGMDSFRNALLENSQIKSIAASTNYPANNRFPDTMFEVKETSARSSMVYITVDYDYADTYNFDMIAGRNFSRQFATDSVGGIILNESAVKKLGLETDNAVGKELIGMGDFLPFKEYKIIGVTKDYHFRSMHESITPCLLILYPKLVSYISVKIGPGRIDEAVNFIEKTWSELFPRKDLNFSFIDQRIQNLYESEQRMGTIIMIFSAFSVFVACLGLFGLASFTAEEKTKEIGIRKVLGSSVGEIITMLSKRFVVWIGLANLIAWPVAYYLMDSWLQDFAFKTELSLEVFVIPGFLALVVALLTVGYQSIKAALANPVHSLKHE